MILPRRRPEIKTFEHQLEELDKASEIARYVLGSMENDSAPNVEEVIYSGYDNLITRFTDYGSPIHDALVPNVLTLKKLLGEHRLQNIEQLSAKDLLIGIKVSRNLMLAGQDIKNRKAKGKKVAHDEVVRAIGAPSVETHPEALAVGTAGHIIERTMMEHLRRSGVDTTGWVKDQILWALEDLAVLSHVESLCGAGDESVLYKYFASAPSLENGGMGWRKPDNILQATQKYWNLLDDETHDMDVDAETRSLRRIRLLPELMGFERDQKLRSLEEQTVDSLLLDVGKPIGEESASLLNEYDEISEQKVDSVDDRAKANVGKMISKAVIYYRANRLKNYIDELCDARTLLANISDHNSAELRALGAEIDARIDEQDQIIDTAQLIVDSNDFGITEDDFAGIDNLFIEQAIELLIEVLTGYGIEDPEEYLVSIGATITAD